jgi:hypothetical protein
MMFLEMLTNELKGGNILNKYVFNLFVMAILNTFRSKNVLKSHNKLHGLTLCNNSIQSQNKK